LTGPAGNIAPGLEFDSQYHGHIHEDGRYTIESNHKSHVDVFCHFVDMVMLCVMIY